MTLGQAFHFFVRFEVKIESFIGDLGSGINFDWEVVCSFFRLKWLILEIVFMYLWRFVHGEVFPWRFYIVSIFGDSHYEDFLFLEICSWKFLIYFENLFFKIVPLWRFVHCLSLRFKNCFGLLVLRLKIFVLVIWLRVGVWNFDWLGVKFEVWNDLSTLVVYMG